MQEDPTLHDFYWHDPNGRGNFGDELSALLLSHFTQLPVEWSSPGFADIVCVGSILHHLPPGWPGVVAGSGLIKDHSLDLRSATVLGVRGYETLRRLNIQPRYVTIGDPALLASELVSADPGRFKLGIVPQWTDTKLWPRERERAIRYGYADPILIDPRRHPNWVLQLIGSCDKIVSSSLHGIIVADSFGVPRRAERHALMDTDPYETDFKWIDYGSSIGQAVEFGKLQTPSLERIYSLQHNLFEMFQEVRSLYVP